jgi:hypothetical protein
LLGKDDREPKNFEEHCREEGIVIGDVLGKLTKKLLVYLRGGHECPVMNQLLVQRGFDTTVFDLRLCEWPLWL